jgi:hypothetical protein
MNFLFVDQVVEEELKFLFVDQAEELVEPLFVDQEVGVELKMNFLFVDQVVEVEM